MNIMEGSQEECRCVGAGEGRIDCHGVNGDCYDHDLKQWFREGETWETRHAENGHLMDCVCQDKGNQIRIDCTTGNRLVVTKYRVAERKHKILSIQGTENLTLPFCYTVC